MLTESIKAFNISTYMDRPDNALIQSQLDTRAITEQLARSLPDWQTKLVLLHPKRRAGDFNFASIASRTKHSDMLTIGNTLLTKHLGIEETHLHPFKYKAIIETLIDGNDTLKAEFATFDVPNLARLQTTNFLMKLVDAARQAFILPDDTSALLKLAPRQKFYDLLNPTIQEIAISLYPSILLSAEAQLKATVGGRDSHKIDNWDLVYWSVYYNLSFTQYDWLLVEHLDQLCPLVRIMLKRMAKGHIISYGRAWDENISTLEFDLHANIYHLDSLDDLKRPAPIELIDNTATQESYPDIEPDSPRGESLPDPAELDTEVDFNEAPSPLPVISSQDALYTLINNLTLAQTDVLLKHFQLAINTLEAHKTALSKEVVLC